MTGNKRPVSVLVVIHTPELEVLLLERALHAGYWQSVTGSQEDGETLLGTARREVAEETGIAAEQPESDMLEVLDIDLISLELERRLGRLAMDDSEPAIVDDEAPFPDLDVMRRLREREGSDLRRDRANREGPSEIIVHRFLLSLWRR